AVGAFSLSAMSCSVDRLGALQSGSLRVGVVPPGSGGRPLDYLVFQGGLCATAPCTTSHGHELSVVASAVLHDRNRLFRPGPSPRRVLLVTVTRGGFLLTERKVCQGWPLPGAVPV